MQSLDPYAKKNPLFEDEDDFPSMSSAPVQAKKRPRFEDEAFDLESVLENSKKSSKSSKKSK